MTIKAINTAIVTSTKRALAICGLTEESLVIVTLQFQNKVNHLPYMYASYGIVRPFLRQLFSYETQLGL